MTENLYQELWEDAPCGQFSTSPAGAIVMVNDTFLRMSGRRREDVLGRPFEQFLSSGSQLYLNTQYQQALLVDGAVSEVQLWLRHPGGTDVPVLVYATTHPDSDGTPGCVRATVVDASNQQTFASKNIH